MNLLCTSTRCHTKHGSPGCLVQAQAFSGRLPARKALFRAEAGACSSSRTQAPPRSAVQARAHAVDTVVAPAVPVSEEAEIIDDLEQLLQILPKALGQQLMTHPRRSELLEVVLDLGRQPEARFLNSQGEYLRDEVVTREELAQAAAATGSFGSDNRAGIPGTLHRISAMRSRKGDVVGLTCRVGRAVTGHVDMVQDILEEGVSMLFLGRPGVGKTTVIREIARVLADVLQKRVVIVDTSNEIGGDGDVPHPAIGGARRMQVADASKQHLVMIEAVENHMPQVVIVDEIGTEAEALACRTIAERGVILIATAHGMFLENLIKNPTLSDLVGGVESVTLGDDEARSRGCQKTILERRAPPTFPIVLEMRDRTNWVAHATEQSVDALLLNKVPRVQLRTRHEGGSKHGELECQELGYDQIPSVLLAQLKSKSTAASPTASMDGTAGGSSSSGGSAIGPSSNASTTTTSSSSWHAMMAMASSDAMGAATAAAAGGSRDLASLDAVAAAAEDPWAWVQRFQELSEGEALQELQVMKYLGGQGALLGPKAGGFLHARVAGPAAAATPAGKGKRKQRATKANAKRR